MYAVVAEVEPKSGSHDDFLHYYNKTIVPFAHSKTKVKEIKVLTDTGSKTVTIVRLYENKSDSEPLLKDEAYKSIVSKVASFLDKSPKRRLMQVHS